MNNNPIGFIDSGLGGISVLKEVRKLLPFENYIYYGDSINNPYGEKTDKEIIDIIDNIVKKLLDLKCKLIVIACNTATATSIECLRKKYRYILFVGTEPAIKVVYDNYRFKKNLVMATPSTIKSKRFNNLREKYKLDNATYLPCPNLAKLIEDGCSDKIDKYLNKIHERIKNIDIIVLGCTHYSFIKKNIYKEFGNIILVDGNHGISKRVEFLLKTNDLKGLNKYPYVKVINSKNLTQAIKSYKLLVNENKD